MKKLLTVVLAIAFLPALASARDHWDHRDHGFRGGHSGIGFSFGINTGYYRPYYVDYGPRYYAYSSYYAPAYSTYPSYYDSAPVYVSPPVYSAPSVYVAPAYYAPAPYYRNDYSYTVRYYAR